MFSEYVVSKELHPIDNVILYISKTPETLGTISLKPSIDNYDFSSSTKRPLNDHCKALMKELLGKHNFQVINKQSKQGKGRVVARECLTLRDTINPAQFHSMLIKKIQIDAENQLDPLRNTLIAKIDAYLTWREKKNSDDGRGYALGFFTKLRHYSQFGQNRAEKFRDQLLMDITSFEELKKALKDHFNHHSRVHNHSLDTYLLEGMMEHRALFIANGFNLNDDADRIKKRDEMIQFEI